MEIPNDIYLKIVGTVLNDPQLTQKPKILHPCYNVTEMPIHRRIAGTSLRFSRCKRLSSHLEIFYDGFEQRISVFYNNGSIEAPTFNDSTSSANGKTLWSSVFLEPCQKKRLRFASRPSLSSHI